MLKYLFILCLILVFINLTNGSIGERSQFFQNCVNNCREKNCTEDGWSFTDNTKQAFMNKILFWTCDDECKYDCMWRTTNSFLDRKWAVPQFYGKWPFLRIFGFQEPASVVFSILNFLAHFKMIQRFRKEVRKDSPCYKVWHIFAGISLNAWFWSTVFHTRDFPLTELFDYGFAYSMVLSGLYCFTLRILHRRSNLVKTLVTLLFTYYFLNHFAYLSIGKFDYSYNMKANIITGVFSSVGWIFWYIRNRRIKTYSWKIFLFHLLVGATVLLEVNDFPPIFWIFDAHAIWHLSTVPITILFYSFVIDDCKDLRLNKIKLHSE